MPMEPPPPPPPPDEDEEEDELELELEPELLDPGGAGVGPGVMAAAQAADPALAGAELTVRVDSTTISAESVRACESVTVTRSVNEPTVGASTVADAVLAFSMAGGLSVGATTVQA